MYKISDAQIDFMLNDIRARGLEMESLQESVLDHICCIIEQNLKENEDFEKYYHTTIQSFYKNNLWEIEEETIQLLIFKNYYTMKKTTIISGILSASILSIGIVLKFLMLPGAAVFIMLGILGSSLVFLPLFFALRLKENSSRRDKLVTGLGALVAILISLHILFKVLYWPGANMLGIIGGLMLIAVFIPVYFFTGFRNPETKNNSVIVSAILVIGCGLFLTMMRTPNKVHEKDVIATQLFLNSEYVLANEKQFVATQKLLKNQKDSEDQNIFNLCADIKSHIIESETGVKQIDEHYATQAVYIQDSQAKQYFDRDALAQQKLTELSSAIEKYNAVNPSKGKKLPLLDAKSIIAFINLERSVNVLNMLTQIQLQVLQNERWVLAEK